MEMEGNVFKGLAYWGWWAVIYMGGEEREKVENIMRKSRRGKKKMGKRVAKKGILW